MIVAYWPVEFDRVYHISSAGYCIRAGNGDNGHGYGGQRNSEKHEEKKKEQCHYYCSLQATLSNWSNIKHKGGKKTTQCLAVLKATACKLSFCYKATIMTWTLFRWSRSCGHVHCTFMRTSAEVPIDIFWSNSKNNWGKLKNHVGHCTLNDLVN